MKFDKTLKTGKLVCKSCSASDFSVLNTFLTCNYCGTVYKDIEKIEYPLPMEYKRILRHKFNELIVNNCIIYGNFLDIQGNYNIVIGSNNVIEGNGNDIQGNYNECLGTNNKIKGKYNINKK
jgi:hypothetical protein